MLNKYLSTNNSYTTIFIRLMTGLVFLTEGIQKFLYPDALGVGRFIKIGILYPGFSAPFVGVVEIAAGAFLVIGLLTRFSALLLLINISVAIITTKIPMLSGNFWVFTHESRTDFCMFLGTIFLLITGSGKWAVDYYILKKSRAKMEIPE